MTLRLPGLTRLVRAGEAVSAGNDGRPILELDDKVNYVWQLLQAAAAGVALRLPRQAVAPECVVGSPVYWDGPNDRFAPCLASAVADANGLTVPDSAFPVGVVRRKLTADTADVTLGGVDEIDFRPASAGEYAAGDYWASPRTAGRLTRDRPAVAALALRHFGGGVVLVSPGRPDLSDRHVHYPFELAARPAGSVEIDNGRYVFRSADAAVAGWLPADHAVFQGNAPAGATYGYNLPEHAGLNALWPPLPAAGAYLEWDRDGVSGYVGVPGAYHLVDRNGLWWLTDCDGEAPWDDLHLAASASPAMSESASMVGLCPTPGRRRLRLWFTRPQAATRGGLVTSLTSVDARLVVRCANGAEGAAGDLVASLELAFLLAEGGAGYRAVVGLSADGETLLRAPVATGVYSTSAGVALAGEAATRLDPADPSSPLVHHGAVRLTVDPSPTHQVSPELYRLDGATTEFSRGVPYVGLPPAVASSVLGRIRVPDDLAYAAPALTLRFRLVASSAGSVPALAVTARRVPAPSGLDALPTEGADFAVAVATNRTAGSSPAYYDAGAAPFAVAAGDTVLVTLARGDSDGYAGTVGLLDLTGVFSEAA